MQSNYQPFAALVLDAKAVAQITCSFSLTWPALAQRERDYRISNCAPDTRLIRVRSIDSLFVVSELSICCGSNLLVERIDF